MKPWLLLVLAFLAIAALANADELIFRYECDVSPPNASPAWLTADACDQACSESLEPGHLVFSWPPVPASGRFVNYHLLIGSDSNPPPLPFWVEWRFASNVPVWPTFTEDGVLLVDHGSMQELTRMCGDAIISNDGGTFVVGLPLNEFRTFRFQTTGDNEYCVWYDGRLFLCDFGDTTSKIDYLQLRGSGGISPTQNGPIINRWDYVRYGRVTSGEVIVGATPPGGILDAAQYPKLDRFIVTFDQPNYVYVADIVVDVIANQYRDREGAASMTGNIPIVIATRRQDNGPPETVEIVLDWPLAVGTTTRFTFNTGGTSNTVEYTLVEFDPCCLPSGLCADLESNDCTAQGGTTASSGCEGDTDSDGRDAACGDACPTDPTKFAAGQCGCGVPDTDSDSDTIADCLDQCPTDSAKTAPGQCGCGLPDTDSDSDTIADCLDQCPGRDDRIDADSNNIPDCLESPFIPTASTWGLAILTLLLITAAKLFFPHSVPRKAS